MVLEKIVSGGQTGVDRGALEGALERGFPCGGWCPPNRRAEDGAIPERYPLTELSEGGYRDRTLRNVADSDGTALIYFGEIEGGTEATLWFCIRQRKPCKLLDAELVSPGRAAAVLAEFAEENRIKVLNVAGPRASKSPGAEEYARTVVRELLGANERGSGEHCCETMRYWARHRCERHPDPADCPGNIIFCPEAGGTYGIRLHDGNSSHIEITHCPWCGTSLSESAPGTSPQALRPQALV